MADGAFALNAATAHDSEEATEQEAAPSRRRRARSLPGTPWLPATQLLEQSESLAPTEPAWTPEGQERKWSAGGTATAGYSPFGGGGAPFKTALSANGSKAYFPDSRW